MFKTSIVTSVSSFVVTLSATATGATLSISISLKSTSLSLSAGPLSASGRAMAPVFKSSLTSAPFTSSYASKIPSLSLSVVAVATLYPASTVSLLPSLSESLSK